jgi:hypothetical protein
MRQQCVCVCVCVCGQKKSLYSPLGTAVDDTHCVASLQNVLLRPPQELLGRSITAYNSRLRSVSSGSRRGEGGEEGRQVGILTRTLSQCGSVCTSPLLDNRGTGGGYEPKGTIAQGLARVNLPVVDCDDHCASHPSLRRRGWLCMWRSCIASHAGKFQPFVESFQVLVQ